MFDTWKIVTNHNERRILVVMVFFLKNIRKSCVGKIMKQYS